MNAIRKKLAAGFTLMEMLLAVAAFGLFISLVLIGVAKKQAMRRDVMRTAHINQMEKALALYAAEYQQYPEMKGCVNGIDPLSKELKDKKYVDAESRLRDPKTPDEIGGCYFYESAGSSYSLRYILETDSVEPKGAHYAVP